jgi:hypothetical protein
MISKAKGNRIICSERLFSHVANACRWRACSYARSGLSVLQSGGPRITLRHYGVNQDFPDMAREFTLDAVRDGLVVEG